LVVWKFEQHPVSFWWEKITIECRFSQNWAMVEQMSAILQSDSIQLQANVIKGAGFRSSYRKSIIIAPVRIVLEASQFHLSLLRRERVLQGIIDRKVGQRQLEILKSCTEVQTD
jgi:hypothetical protein